MTTLKEIGRIDDSIRSSKPKIAKLLHTILSGDDLARLNRAHIRNFKGFKYVKDDNNYINNKQHHHNEETLKKYPNYLTKTKINTIPTQLITKNQTQITNNKNNYINNNNNKEIKKAENLSVILRENMTKVFEKTQIVPEVFTYYNNNNNKSNQLIDLKQQQQQNELAAKLKTFKCEELEKKLENQTNNEIFANKELINECKEITLGDEEIIYTRLNKVKLQINKYEKLENLGKQSEINIEKLNSDNETNVECTKTVNNCLSNVNVVNNKKIDENVEYIVNVILEKILVESNNVIGDYNIVKSYDDKYDNKLINDTKSMQNVNNNLVTSNEDDKNKTITNLNNDNNNYYCECKTYLDDTSIATNINLPKVMLNQATQFQIEDNYNNNKFETCICDNQSITHNGNLPKSMLSKATQFQSVENKNKVEFNEEVESEDVEEEEDDDDDDDDAEDEDDDEEEEEEEDSVAAADDDYEEEEDDDDDDDEDDGDEEEDNDDEEEEEEEEEEEDRESVDHNIHKNIHNESIKLNKKEKNQSKGGNLLKKDKQSNAKIVIEDKEMGDIIHVTKSTKQTKSRIPGGDDKSLLYITIFLGVFTVTYFSDFGKHFLSNVIAANFKANAISCLDKAITAMTVIKSKLQ